MTLYSLATYSIMIILICNKVLDLLIETRFIGISNTSKVAIFVLIAVAMNIEYKHISAAMLVYSALDYPSFTTGIICILALCRIFFDVGLVTNCKGKVLVAAFWATLCINSLGYASFVYGDANYNALVVSTFIALLYVVDANYAVIMLISLATWTFAYSEHNIYSMSIDATVALLLPTFETKAQKRELIHNTTLRLKRS